MMAVVDAVKEPPVDVGRESDEGRAFAIVADTSRAAIEVKSGPFGPMVYRA